MTNSPASIAAGLTEAQRRIITVVAYPDAKLAVRLRGSEYRSGDALQRKGLADWVEGAPSLYNSGGGFLLTPLGLAVRDILRSKP